MLRFTVTYDSAPKHRLLYIFFLKMCPYNITDYQSVTAQPTKINVADSGAFRNSIC